MTYTRGAVARIDYEARDEAGALVDPATLKLLVLSPADASSEQVWPDGEIVRDAKGKFHADVPLTESGTWDYRWEPTGVAAPANGELLVDEDDFDSPADPTRAFTPTCAEVALHMMARLEDELGNETGEEFTDETNPTKRQIEALIPKGVRKVASRIGTTICEGGDPDKQRELYADARDLAALATAIRAERSYFPEQVGSERSPYKQMLDEWKEGMEALTEAVSEHCGGGDGLSVGGGAAGPVSSFPEPSDWQGVQW